MPKPTGTSDPNTQFANRIISKLSSEYSDDGFYAKLEQAIKGSSDQQIADIVTETGQKRVEEIGRESVMDKNRRALRIKTLKKEYKELASLAKEISRNNAGKKVQILKHYIHKRTELKSPAIKSHQMDFVKECQDITSDESK